jgi:hypothetical protein
MEKQLIDYLIDRIEKIDEKVDRLLQFKWQIIGGSVVLSAIITFAIQLAMIYKG